MKRRDLIILAGVLGAAATVSPLLRWVNSGFEFTPISGFDGFRRLKQGPVSSGQAFLIGLDADTSNGNSGISDPRLDPCRYLFGDPPVNEGQVPIAVFSDYFCPYCAVLSGRLIPLAERDSSIRLVFHELPLLSPHSERLARVALAADRQGAYLQVHKRLMERALPPGKIAMQSFAEDMRLDPYRLMQDAQSDAVTRELNASADLAKALGILGTPATMIGRTLVIGSITPKNLDRLIQIERAEGPGFCR